MTKSIVERWRTILDHPGSGNGEIEGDHPLRIVYGATDLGEAVFFFITDAMPGLPELSRSVRIDRGVRVLDRRWTLSLTLVDDRFREVFLRLFDDLVRRSAHASSERHALALVFSGIDEWKQLLRDNMDKRMTIEAIRGLVAELWFGFRILTRSAHADEVLASWTGPLGTPQDFNFPDGRSYEVKSVHPDSRAMTISSAEQLDSGHRELTLAAVSLVRVPATPGTISVRSLVQLAKTEISASTHARDELLDRLDALRVDPDDDYYDEFHFQVRGVRKFSVAPDFPAIRASSLDAGVDRVSYSLRLASITNFEISCSQEETALWT